MSYRSLIILMSTFLIRYLPNKEGSSLLNLAHDTESYSAHYIPSWGLTSWISAFDKTADSVSFMIFNCLPSLSHLVKELDRNWCRHCCHHYVSGLCICQIDKCQLNSLELASKQSLNQISKDCLAHSNAWLTRQGCLGGRSTPAGVCPEHPSLC